MVSKVRAQDGKLYEPCEIYNLGKKITCSVEHGGARNYVLGEYKSSVRTQEIVKDLIRTASYYVMPKV